MTRIQRLHVSYLVAQIPLCLLFCGAVEVLASSTNKPALRAAYLLLPMLQAFAGAMLPKDEGDPYKGDVTIAPVLSGAMVLMAMMWLANEDHPPLAFLTVALPAFFCLAIALCAAMVAKARAGGAAAQPVPANGTAPPKGAGITRDDADALKKKIVDLINDRDAAIDAARQEGKRAKKPEQILADEETAINERYNELLSAL